MRAGELFSYMLYGAILAHWLLHVKRRLLVPDRARFVVVAQHCNRDEFVRVGASPTEARAAEAAEHVDAESNSYMGLVYDMHNINDKEEFGHLNLVSFVESIDIQTIEEAGALCGSG